MTELQELRKSLDAAGGRDWRQEMHIVCKSWLVKYAGNHYEREIDVRFRDKPTWWRLSPYEPHYQIVAKALAVELERAWGEMDDTGDV